MNVAEIIFEVREDEIDGGFNARALGHDVFTQANSLEELRKMVKDAVHCHFGDRPDRPRIVRLHIVRDEMLVI
jgi:hypothetical protein